MSRNHEIRVKLNTDEMLKIQLKAEQLGLSPSTLLRILGITATISPKQKPTK